MSQSQEEHLYAARVPIFPRSVKGRFRNVKYGILALAYGVYFILPWLRWHRDNGPDQAVIFDLKARLFYVFGMTIHPQDIFLLAALLTLAALLLFFVTSVAGRVFCGYFCFQTLWTDVYMMIERLVQGERPARIRLSKQPWNREKILKIGLTHLLWLLVAFWTGLTFVLYWGDAPTLFVEFFTGKAPFPAYATALFLTATTYVMAGLAREQVCIYMCPYSRFQSAMFDKDTLIVSYDARRGEGTAGRHKIAKGYKTREERHAKGVGDCIDCGYCVQACPTGIDIRNGLQVPCIQCALCIDACDTIMDSLGWERGLIGYYSEHRLEGKPTRIIKWKTLGYGLALAAVVGFMTWLVANQAPLDMHVRKIRQPLYVELADGSIQNSYDIKINNKTSEPVRIRMEVKGLPGAKADFGRFREVRIRPQHYVRLLGKVSIKPAPGVSKRQEFSFRAVPIEPADLPEVEAPARFFMP